MRPIALSLALICAPALALAQAPQGGPPSALQTAPQNIKWPDIDGFRSASAALTAAPKTEIANGVLTATVMTPDKDKGFYRGVRFDWSGMISSVRMNATEFYGLWFDWVADDVRDFAFFGDKIVAAPNTAAVGPADAYDATNPVGWAAAAPGGLFLKIGVGMLRKPADGANYNSFNNYELVDGGTWKTVAAKDRVTFTHTIANSATGYGYVYTKEVRLVAGQPVMTISHSLRNTGAKPIETTTFNHNFLTFGGAPTGPGLTVSGGFPIKPERALAGAATFDGTKLTYSRQLTGVERFSTSLGSFNPPNGKYDVSIANAAGASVRVEGDVGMSQMQLWSIRRTVAAEPFITISAAPGQTKRWTFRYTYAAPPAPPPAPAATPPAR